MGDLKISVITVVYNAVKTIERTINSVLTQSYQNIEYIIIDGGSTDGTLNIIEKYRNKLAYFVSEPDNGIYDAMNKGIRKATGDVIGLLNADDWYEPNSLLVINNAFSDGKFDIVYGNIRIIYRDGSVSKSKHSDLKNLFTNMPVSHPATFILRSAYEKYGLFDSSYKIAGDHELILRMYLAEARFKPIDDIITNFMLTGVSSHNYVKTAFENERIFLKYQDLCPEKKSAEKKVKNNIALAKFYEIIYSNEKEVFDYVQSIVTKQLAIWGTGVWGKNISEVFINKGLSIDFFVDSDPKKQGLSLNSAQIKSPDSLKNYFGVVFIAVKDYDVKIEETIKAMNNLNIKSVLLRDFIKAMADYYDEITVKNSVL